MTKEAFVALVTCFNDDETINFDATRAQVRRQVLFEHLALHAAAHVSPQCAHAPFEP